MTNAFTLPRFASKALFDAFECFSSDEGDECDEANLVLNPNKDDVLLGRGKSNQKHPGNIVFRGKDKKCRLVLGSPSAALILSPFV
jgi:hypothetical protein